MVPGTLPGSWVGYTSEQNKDTCLQGVYILAALPWYCCIAPGDQCMVISLRTLSVDWVQLLKVQSLWKMSSVVFLPMEGIWTKLGVDLNEHRLPRAVP